MRSPFARRSARAAVASIRQLLTESVLLALVGGVVGVMIAEFLGSALVARAPGAESLLSPGQSAIDYRVFAFAFVVALVVGVAAGLFPAFQFSRLDVAGGLRDFGRTHTPGRSARPLPQRAGRGRWRFRWCCSRAPGC